VLLNNVLTTNTITNNINTGSNRDCGINTNINTLGSNWLLIASARGAALSSSPWKTSSLFSSCVKKRSQKN